jgi:hypothetical protein
MSVYAFVDGEEVELTSVSSCGEGAPPDDGEAWRRAMQDPRFVADQDEFLSLAAEADSEALDDPSR